MGGLGHGVGADPSLDGRRASPYALEAVAVEGSHLAAAGIA